MSEDNKRLVQRWFEEVWNQGRDSAIDELLSLEGKVFGLTEPDTEVQGPEQFKPFVHNLRDAFPDMHVTVEDMLAEADKVIARFRVTGTHKGGGLGVAATGRKINITGMSIVQIKNEKLVQGWSNWDQLGMMQQLGVASGPVRVDEFLEPRPPMDAKAKPAGK